MEDTRDIFSFFLQLIKKSLQTGMDRVNVLYLVIQHVCLTYPFQKIREPCVDVRLQYDEVRSVEVDKNDDQEKRG